MVLNPGFYTFTAFIFILVATSPYFLLIGDKGYFVNDIKALSSFIFITVLALGFSNLGWIAISAGYEPSILLSTEGLGLVAAESVVIRYQDGQSNSGNPVILAFSLWLIFRLSLGGVKHSRYKIGLAFLPLIGYTILTTEKFALLLGLAFYAVGALSFGSFRDNLSTIWKSSWYSLLLVPILLLSMLMRGHESSDFSAFLYQLLSYVFFQYYGLGFWLVEKYNDAQLMFGSLTFAGPLSALDIVERKSGIYSYSYSIKGLQSNIYTAYRNISEDFSIYFPFIFNLFISILYLHFHAYRFKSGLVLLKIFLLFFVVLSFTTTPFVYNSVVLAIVLCLLNVQFQMKNISRIKGEMISPT
tara:strand:+ start:1050 stop:2120 length:1071 start_codon:yes stop_codon:yes gene_type:complete